MLHTAWYVQFRTISLFTKAMQKQTPKAKITTISETEVNGQYLCLLHRQIEDVLSPRAVEGKTLKPDGQVNHFSLILVILSI